MAAKGQTAAPEAATPLSFAAMAEQAKAVGGELAAEDRLTGDYDGFPIFSVVGKNAKDVNWYDEQREENISRAGQFRFIRGREIEAYYKRLEGCVVLEVRKGQTAFNDEGVLCRGLTQIGMKGVPVCIAPDGLLPVGTECNKCALWRWNKADTHPITGKPIDPQKDYCKAGLELFIYHPSVGKDDEGNDCPGIARVQFSAMAIGPWEETVKPIEKAGAKLWAFRMTLKPFLNTNKDKDKSDYFTAEAIPEAVMSPEEFAEIEVIRAECQKHLAELTKMRAALSAGSQVVEPTEEVVEAAYVPDDPFQNQ